jgi:hypothetical protein
MRTLIAALLFAELASVKAQQPSVSEELKEKFLAILKQQVTAMMNEAASQARQAPTPEEISRAIESVMKEAQTNYGPLLTLPEAEANQLLTTGPNNKANLAAIQRDIERWRKVQRPMPVLLKRMQDEVVAGKIQSGLELELTRRISEFHLSQLSVFNP